MAKEPDVWKALGLVFGMLGIIIHFRSEKRIKRLQTELGEERNMHKLLDMQERYVTRSLCRWS